MLEGIGNPLSAYALAFEPRLRVAVPTKLVFEFSEMKRLSQLAFSAAGTSQATTPDAPSEAARFVTEFVEYLVRYTSHREENAAIDAANGEKPTEGRKKSAASNSS